MSAAVTATGGEFIHLGQFPSLQLSDGFRDRAAGAEKHLDAQGVQTPQGTGAHSTNNNGVRLGAGQRLEGTTGSMDMAMIPVSQELNVHGLCVRQCKASR